MITKLLCCFTLLLGGFMIENETFNTLTQNFYNTSEIIMTMDGKNLNFKKGDDKYECILKSLKTITDGAHEMPAFGVSLDEETRKARKSGLWLELVFDKEYEYNGMPFEALLIDVHGDFSGFNLIRKCNGKYDGRCFYLDLKEDMKNLETSMLDIFNAKSFSQNWYKNLSKC